jgi:hypothetical protein
MENSCHGSSQTAAAGTQCSSHYSYQHLLQSLHFSILSTYITGQRDWHGGNEAAPPAQYWRTAHGQQNGHDQHRVLRIPPGGASLDPGTEADLLDVDNWDDDALCRTHQISGSEREHPSEANPHARSSRVAV